MASADPQDMAVYPTTVVVCSESEPSKTYLVQLPYCPCLDFRYRRSNPEKYPDSPYCKHLREAMRRAGGWHREPGPQVFADLTRLQARTILLGAGQRSRTITGLLDRIQVHHGKDSFRSAGADLPDGEVTYDQPTGRYTIALQH
jgi:hypothetical protein